jgi:hypothetical protein
MKIHSLAVSILSLFAYESISGQDSTTDLEREKAIGLKRPDSIIKKSNKEDSSLQRNKTYVASLDDTLFCPQILLARHYEADRNYEKALQAYNDALSCDSLKIKRESISAIVRIEHKSMADDTSAKKRITDLLKEIGGIVLNAIKIILYLVLIYGILYLIKLLVLLYRRTFEQRRIRVSVGAIMTSLASVTQDFYTKQLKASIAKALAEQSYQVKLKKALRTYEVKDGRPVIQSSELSSLLDLSVQVAAPNISGLLSKLYIFLFPADCNISGFANFITENAAFVTLEVRAKGLTLKKWEFRTYTLDLNEHLAKVAFEMSVYIKESKNDTKFPNT